MRFLRPDVAWWLLGALALVVVIRWKARRRYAASTTVGFVGPDNRASLLRRAPFVPLFAAFVFASVGLMEPALPFAQTHVTSRGLDLVLVLDLSTSMLEPIGIRALQQKMGPIVEGATPKGFRLPTKTRLEATKDAIKDFVTRRREDRLGLVVFSNNAYVVSPLSADHEYLREYIDMIGGDVLSGEGMTAIGEGLALANHLLARQAGGDMRGRVVVLLTDGESNKGRDPVEVLAQSDAAGVRVHIVGVDIETRTRQKEEVERLVAAVRGYGGRYFDAATVADLEAASREIDGLEKGTLTSKVFERDVPVFHWFVIPALVCLALSLALGAIPHFANLT
ncbi:MAG: VWA domain-containing protein [Acidobacteriota bacterium]